MSLTGSLGYGYYGYAYGYAYGYYGGYYAGYSGPFSDVYVDVNGRPVSISFLYLDPYGSYLIYNGEYVIDYYLLASVYGGPYYGGLYYGPPYYVYGGAYAYYYGYYY
jgi:hypothetical protein